MSYTERREQIYGPLRQQGNFSWDYLYGQEYALASLGCIGQQDKWELSRATKHLGSIFARTVLAAQRSGDALLNELGIPPKAFDAVRLPIFSIMPTLFGRFDFARTVGGWKMLEFNADTPGGLMEAYRINEAVCRFYGVSNPNKECEADIARSFSQAITLYKELGYPVDQIAFSALEWHAEDNGTMQFLRQASGLTATFIALKDLRVYRDRLCGFINGELVPIDVWIRLHPLGILSEETDKDGYPTGAHVLALIAQKRLAALNPASALLAQTKALQALIWNLYEAREFFTASERDVIGQYMLPTYFENRFVGKYSYVVKPILGREGGGVSIYNADGTLLEQSSDGSYKNQKTIYQKFVEMEMVTVETLRGLLQGFVIWGSFLMGGQASAVNARVGGRITDDLSYFLPVEFIK